MSLSPAPDLLAATWVLLREAQLAGRAPRVDKEAVATAVSAANRCLFCVDAHTALVHAAGAHELAEALWRGTTPADPDQEQLIAWASATAAPGSTALGALPFTSALAAEYTGTALVTHFINRMVSSLLNDTLLPGRLRESPLVRRIAGRTLGRVVKRNPRPGDGLGLLPAIPREALPSGAGESPIGLAYAALRVTATTGGSLLSDPAREQVLATISSWEGAEATRLDEMVADALPAASEADRAGARLALLAALDPHGVSDVDVAAWRTAHAGDADLIRLLAFGAFAAVERIACWTTAAWQPARPEPLAMTGD
jgi:AhpD family alkylhydroperoxidase